MNKKRCESAYKNKVQILTMTPESWSRSYAGSYFEVSKYTKRQARSLKNEKYIISLPEIKIGKKMSSVTIPLFIYQDDENSRLLLGRKG